MIYTKNTKQLRKDIETASLLIKKTKDKEVKFAMANYISNIYRALMDLEDDVIVDPKKAFRTKRDYHRFIERINVYDEQLLDSFISNKGFHNDYLGETTDIISTLEVDSDSIDPEVRVFSESDFCDILFQFLRDINQEKLFDQFIKRDKIISQRKSEDGNLGSILFNPVSGRSKIFVREFDYTIPKMNTLVHEMGHAFDYNDLGPNPGKFNQYFYVSFYSEVLSRFFEKLFRDYLINNDIEIETAKSILERYDVDNYFDHFNAFLLSTLSTKELTESAYLDFDEKSFYRRFKDYFESVEDAKTHLETSGQIDLSEVYCYAYGDIIATFLFEEFKKNGFYNKAFHDFMRNRFNPFSRKMFEENDWSPKEFGKLYRKELEIIRK